MKEHTSQRYIMEDPREARRLALKVDADHWVASYLRPYLHDVRQVLDVGCGPGVIACAIGKQDPQIHVTGLDASQERIRVAQRNMEALPNVSVHHGVATSIPFESNRFDLAYCRFLLEYLADPAQAIAEMVRVCAPGGTVLLQDLDGNLVWHYPPDEELQAAIDTILQFVAHAGFDPFIGRKLFLLAHSAGLTKINVRAESYHLISGKAKAQIFEQWDLKLDIALPIMTQALGSRAAALDTKKRFLDYLLREDTLTYSIVFTITGVKP